MDRSNKEETVLEAEGLPLFPWWSQLGQTEADMYDQAVGRAVE